MLERMSGRTTPLSVRTFGPFVPSPGNGPAVSCGTWVHDAVAVVDDEPPVDPDGVLPVVLDAPLAPESSPDEPQAARTATPAAPARSLSACRRSIGALRSMAFSFV
jgi:hypothetical protein